MIRAFCACALLIFLLGAFARDDTATEVEPAAPTPSAFYDPPPNAPREPGVLLRSEPLADVTLPAGVQGWRILYTTTIDFRTPATAVATVFAPVDRPAGPLPVIAWAHGTTGVLQKCMPSLASAPAEGIPARDGIVTAGWAVVATDYAFAEAGGPHPYLIGEAEARATLDSVRAARRMPELTLDTRTVVWGHSQGGQAALWTGIMGPRYAPDIELVGIAAIAPAADIARIAAMNAVAERLVGPYVAFSYSRFYSDVRFEEAVRPEALAAASEMAYLCAAYPPKDAQRIFALAFSLDGPALAADANSALAARIAQNRPDKPIAAPLLIAQGLWDDVVPPAATETYVEERCAAGQRLEYWTFAGSDHASIVQPGAPLESHLLAWTKARLRAEPPQANACARRSFE